MSENWNDKPVYIGGNAKSGTTLLSCLVDNHPDILSLPKEVPFKPVGEYLKPGDTPVRNEKELQDLLSEYICRRFSDLRPYSKQEIETSLVLFENYISECNKPKTLKQVYENICHAIIKAFPHIEPPIYRWSFKNVGKRTYRHFLETYPEGKVLHIRRNPYSWILSRITSLKRKGRPISQFNLLTMYKAIRDWKKHEMHAVDIQNKYGKDKVAIIPYEQLVEKPEETMGRVWSFLEVHNYDEKLDPSFFMRSTSPDTARSSGGGIYTEAIDDWKNRLYSHVKMIVKFVAGNTYNKGHVLSGHNGT